MTATLRAYQVMQEAGLQGPAGDGSRHPERVENAINEVWRCDPYMIRINPRPGATRLQAEAAILRRLPAAVRAPRPVASGAASWGEWMVTERLPGKELSRVWRHMTTDDRRRSIVELGASLRALHSVPAPMLEPPGGRDDIPHPLPPERLLQLLMTAADMPGLDRAVFTKAAALLAARADALDAMSTNLVHGDLHLENVLTTEGGTLSGVLDFEWARAGPPDLDLDVLLHSLADPALHVESGSGSPLRRRDFDEVVGWLRGEYPALFAHPRLADRLWVYRLAYDVKDLVAHPGTDRDRTTPHHPYQRVLRLVEGRSDLSWFLAN